MVIIRSARPGDEASLADLARSLGQALEASRFSEDIASYEEGFYVAELDGTIIGYLILRLERSPGCVQGRSPIQLWRLFVSSQYQGTGVAANLLSRAFAHARAKQHDVVWLGTLEDNARAIAFYRKNGFRSVGTAQLHHDHDSREDLIMSCAVQ